MKYVNPSITLLLFLFGIMSFPACSNNKGADKSGETAALLALAGDNGGWAWQSESSTPVFTKLITLEEDAAIGSPDVIAFDDGGARKFRMVYAQGGTDTKGRIGMAESPDGRVWTRKLPVGEPSILVPAASGNWDSWFLDTPCILLHGGTWYLWYFGADPMKFRAAPSALPLPPTASILTGLWAVPAAPSSKKELPTPGTASGWSRRWWSMTAFSS